MCLINNTMSGLRLRQRGHRPGRAEEGRVPAEVGLRGEGRLQGRPQPRHQVRFQVLFIG